MAIKITDDQNYAAIADAIREKYGDSDVYGTASGGVASFETEVEAPVKSLTVKIEPVQEGEGDPSPENVRPIRGWDGVTVTRMGKNLLDPKTIAPVTTKSRTSFNADGSWTVNTIGIPSVTSYFNINSLLVPGKTYSVSFVSGISTIYVQLTGINDYSHQIRAGNSYTFVANGTYCRIVTDDIPKNAERTFRIQLEVGENASEFTPYVDMPAVITQFGQTVYGGTLDVTTGVLTVTHGNIESYNGETLYGTWISSMDVYAEGAVPTIGAQVVYKLANPVTYQLTATEVKTLLGANNIYADAGGVDVTYLKHQGTRYLPGDMAAAVRKLPVFFGTREYGVRFEGSNPAGTRLGDAVGLTAAVGVDGEAVSNGFDKLYPWSEIRRCNGYYNDNGDFVVTAYQGDADYAVDGSNGNVWVEVPLFYVREAVDEEHLTEEAYISPYKLEGYRAPEKFIRLNGDVRAKAYIAAYESGKMNGVPVSVSGVDPSSPLWSHDRFLTACKNIGAGYCAMTMEDHEVIKFLFLVEFATRNVQSVMWGAVNNNTTAVDIAQATTAQNFVLIASSVTAFAAGYAIKLHTTANSAAGDYHIVSGVYDYYEAATSEYDSGKSYFTRSGDAEPYAYTAYTYDASTWDSDWENLWTATDMKKVVLEDDASVTTTTSTKIYNCPFKTGYCDNVAASSGAYRANNGHFPIIYRGIENPWGNIWTVLSGILVNEYQPYYLKDASNDPTNNNATSIINTMTPLGYTITTSNGYDKVMGYDDSAPAHRVTKETGASSNTWYSDYFNVAAGVRCVRLGGDVSYGAYAGLFCFTVTDTPSGAYWAISSRLSYTG